MFGNYSMQQLLKLMKHFKHEFCAGIAIISMKPYIPSNLINYF